MKTENLSELFKLVDENRLVMPDFQRDYVWNKVGQKALAASVLLDLPIGSFLILSGEKDDFATKELGFAKKNGNPKDECKFLLDGQQRLTSLRSIFSDMFEEEDWQQIARDIYTNLKVRWFLKIIPQSDSEDIFGWKSLDFNSENLKRTEPAVIEEILVDKPVHITNTKNWWSPGYVAYDAQGEKINNRKSRKYNNVIAKKMAEDNGLVPLYVIYNEDKNKLFECVLDHIAETRKLELRAEVNDSKIKAIELFNKLDPEITEEDIDDDFIEKCLNKLAEKWKQAILNFFSSLLTRTEAQQIDLPASEISRAVIIFERINKGGTSLDNFDLVVARAARDKERYQESLTKRIINALEEKIDYPSAIISNLIKSKPSKFISSELGTVKSNEIDNVIKKQYLNLLSILAYTNYGIVEEIKLELTKKDKILNISHTQINDLTPKVVLGLKRACAFLHIRCGIVKISELHYNLMLIPLAYVLLDEEIWNSKESIDKVEYWYWGSIFSGEYRMYPNEKSIKDTQELYKWIKDCEEISRYKKFQENVLEIEDFCDKDTLSLINDDNEIPSVIHKSLLQYQLSNQPKDMLFDIMLNTWELVSGRVIKAELDGKIYDIELKVDDHHIIPLGTATTILESSKDIRNDKKHKLNSILNRTLVLSKTNNIFSNKEPIKYLEKVSSINDNTVLRGHFISSEYKENLNSNAISNKEKINEFYEKRYDMIKTIMNNEMNQLYNSVD